jgi:hypothetical protein
MRKASKTERGWRRRFEFSVAVARQGDWEQRLDQRANIYFFHHLPRSADDYRDVEEVLSETCQWEVPVTWSGDVLLTTDQKNLLKDTLDPSLNLESQANQDSAFSQPSEIWLPHTENVKSSHLSDDRTPGAQASGVIRSGQTKGGSRLGTGTVGGSSLVGFSSSFMTKTGPKDQMKPSQSMSTAGGAGTMAEDLLLNDDIVYALARRLGLSTDKIVPVSQLPSVFTMSQAGDESTMQPPDESRFRPFASLQSTSLNDGNPVSPHPLSLCPALLLLSSL